MKFIKESTLRVNWGTNFQIYWILKKKWTKLVQKNYDSNSLVDHFSLVYNNKKILTYALLICYSMYTIQLYLNRHTIIQSQLLRSHQLSLNMNILEFQRIRWTMYMFILVLIHTLHVAHTYKRRGLIIFSIRNQLYYSSYHNWNYRQCNYDIKGRHLSKWKIALRSDLSEA